MSARPTTRILAGSHTSERMAALARSTNQNNVAPTNQDTSFRTLPPMPSTP